MGKEHKSSSSIREGCETTWYGEQKPNGEKIVYGIGADYAFYYGNERKELFFHIFYVSHKHKILYISGFSKCQSQ